MNDRTDQDPHAEVHPEACASMSNLLQPFVDDELEGHDFESVSSHLRECATCRQEVSLQQRVRETLRALEREPLPEALVARIRGELDRIDAGESGSAQVLELEPRSRRRAFARGIGMMMPAAAAAVALFFVVRQNPAGDTASVSGVVEAADSASPEPSSRLIA